MMPRFEFFNRITEERKVSFLDWIGFLEAAFGCTCSCASAWCSSNSNASSSGLEPEFQCRLVALASSTRALFDRADA